MRIFSGSVTFFILLSVFSAGASLKSENANEVANNKKDLSKASVEHQLDGFLTPEELKDQYRRLLEGGIEAGKNYKWEFRFQGRIMSSLEEFAQLSHMFDFWPVALESTIDGEMYWLYIQKTDSYNEEKFVKQVSALFEMAKHQRLTRFDGFSVDHPDEDK